MSQILYTNQYYLSTTVIYNISLNMTQIAPHPPQSTTKSLSSHLLFLSLNNNMLIILAKQLISQGLGYSLGGTHHTANLLPSSKCDKNGDANIQKTTDTANCSIFRGSFRMETLSEECKMWFDNVKEIYQFIADADQNGIQIRKRDNNAELILSFDVEIKKQKIKKICKLPLQAAPYTEILVKKEEKVDSQDQVQMVESGKMQEDDYEQYIPKSHQSDSKQKQKKPKKASISVQSFKKIQNTAQKMNQFVSTFIQKMQQKWTVVLQQINQLKQREKRMRCKIDQISILNKTTPIPNYKLKHTHIYYKFSQKYRNDNIKLITPTVAVCYSLDSTFKNIMVDPASFFISNEPFSKMFQICFKIKKLKNYIALGICQKLAIKAQKFRSLSTDVRDHGCYLVDWNGQAWSNYRKQDTSSYPIKSLKFKEDDIIKISFSTNKKLIKFIKNNETETSLQMLVDPFIALHSICFCAFLCGDGDEIQIIQETKRNYNKDAVNNHIVIDSDDADKDFMNESSGNKKEVTRVNG